MTVEELKNGESLLKKDLDMSDYQSAPCLSKSMVSLMMSKTPLHMWREYIKEREEVVATVDKKLDSYPHYQKFKASTKKHFSFGTALHCYALEPENLAKYVAVRPDVKLTTNKGKEEFNLFLSKLNGDEAVITKDEMEDVRLAGENIVKHPMSEKLLSKSGFVESSIFWRDSNGVLKKCRPDFINTGLDIIVDIKTDKDADPWKFKYNAKKYKYHISHALSAEGYEAYFGRPLKAYIYLVIEKSTMDIIYYNSSEECLVIGQSLLEEFVPIYKKCLDNDDWTGYPETILDLPMP